MSKMDASSYDTINEYGFRLAFRKEKELPLRWTVEVGNMMVME